eukprot:5254786-Pyramimonas_sp.AAC.1
MSVRGPPRNQPPRGTAADGWVLVFALPAVGGDPSAKTHAVEQALAEEALEGRRAWKELQEEPRHKRARLRSAAQPTEQG